MLFDFEESNQVKSNEIYKISSFSLINRLDYGERFYVQPQTIILPKP